MAEAANPARNRKPSSITRMMPEGRRRAHDRAASRTNDGRREGALRVLLAPFVRPERKRLFMIAMSSVFGGLAEAAMLVLLARAAFAIASNHSSIAVNEGPIDNWRVSVPAVLVCAAGCVVLRLLLQAGATVLGAR